MNESKSKGSGLKDSQGVSPRQPGSVQATKVKHKTIEGNSKIFSSIESGKIEKNSVTLPPIPGSRNMQLQEIHSLNGGSHIDQAESHSREDEVVMAPVVDKGKKTEFEMTGTSVKKSLISVTKLAGKNAPTNKEENKNADKEGDEDKNEDEVSQDDAADDENWYEEP